MASNYFPNNFLRTGIRLASIALFYGAISFYPAPALAPVLAQDLPPPLAGGGLLDPDLAEPDDQSPDQPLGDAAVTNAARLRAAIVRIDPAADLLPNGALFTVEGIRVTMVYDINANRMRLVAPVASINDIDDEDLVRMMQANFDSALDARYGLAQGAVWSTFVHPLASLTLDDFASGIGQTVNLVTTFGSSYSSGVLIFGGGDSAEQQRELIDELKDKSKEI